MAKKKKEEVVEQTAEQPKVDDKVGKIKIKKSTMKKFNQNDEPIKVDMNKQKEKEDEQPLDVTKTQEVQEKIIEETTDKEEVVEQSTKENVETPVVEEITNEETEEIVEELEEQVEEAVAKAEATGKPIPENIQKLMDFMEETGGDINDYVKLNQDYSGLDNLTLLREYYTQTKPHLNNEEINFLMEDQFSYDEEVDEERDIRRKKLALKEQVASAKAHLDGQKSKYYEEIKAGSKLTDEQQKAINFFNRYNKESEEQNKLTQATKKTFQQRTNKVFNDKFKGFDYQVGDKKFRFNVKDANKVKETQSDINNFVNKFVGEDKTNIEDAKGYHKSLFTAMNADAIANHFYEQGKADAIKGQVAKDKNINLNPRQTHGETPGGFKYKVLGETSSDFKFKIKNKKIKK